LRNCAEEDEQNIFSKNLETCLEKQPIDYANQPIDILQQEELPKNGGAPKEWRIPRDLYVENIIGHRDGKAGQPIPHRPAPHLARPA